MAVSTIGVADAGTPDKYLHTHSRTISATAREDQYVLQGESANPTYSVATSQNADTANVHILQLMGDGTNYTRIKRISILPYFASVESEFAVEVRRLSSAGTGGGALTPSPFDSADTYAGGAMALPSSKGTEGALLLRASMHITDTSAAVAAGSYTWEQAPGAKPIIIGPATSSGVAIKAVNTISGAICAVNVEFITTTYL